ncbi:MAG: SRPBCC family protein [Chloroflexi bacterium]|nr:SRPBCC family protein [Chloroflexota bacterium]
MAIEFNVEVQFNASPEKVFHALTSVDTFVDWMPNLKEVKVLSEGDIGEGTVYEETRRMFFRDATERFRISKYEPPDTLELTVDGSEGSSGSGQYTFFYRLGEDADNGGTSMSMRGEITGLNKVMEFMGRLGLRFMVRAIRKDYHALASHLAAQSNE